MEIAVLLLITMLWLGVAVWVYFDARKRNRSGLGSAVPVFLFPGVGIAVYFGLRGAEEHELDPRLDPVGQRLLRELTAEVERLRLRVAELESELHARTGGPQ